MKSGIKERTVNEMELWQEVIVNKWRRLDNGEVMGWQVAREARDIAEFFEGLGFLYYDTYGTGRFSTYIEGQIRGFLFNEQLYDEMSITTTNDLHDVMCSSYGLHEFDYYMSERWRDRFMFALENGI